MWRSISPVPHTLDNLVPLVGISGADFADFDAYFGAQVPTAEAM